MAPIVAILRLHQIEAFLDRWEEHAVLLEHPRQGLETFRRQMAEAVVIFSDQPLVGLRVTSVLALEQDFPTAERLKKCPLVLRRASQALRRLLWRGCCVGQYLSHQLP